MGEQSRRQVPAQAPALAQDPVIAAIEPALKVGAACGTAGFLFGGAIGIVRGLPPGLAGGISAIQTFTLGTSFSATRTALIHAWTVDGKPVQPGDLVKASSLAGSISGGLVGFLFRGRSNAIPGAVMFAIFGAAGQFATNRWTTPRDTVLKENFWKRMSDKSWTPFKLLSNDEYVDLLKEKMLKLDVEIAVLDDKISALKEEQSSEKETGTVQAGSFAR